MTRAVDPELQKVRLTHEKEMKQMENRETDEKKVERKRNGI